MEYFGQITKMSAKLDDEIIYHFNIGNNSIELNNKLSKNIKINFKGKINCMECDAEIKKTFMQGYCYPCFISLPQTSECIFKPHLCKAHLGESRDMEWATKNCLTDQYVYLSLTSNLKVGVTRESQIPTRWIDQGAHYAIKFAKTPNRYLAGMIELEVSKHISDRTNWRRMLKGDYEIKDLLVEKNKLTKMLPNRYSEYISKNDTITSIAYPHINNLDKIKSINIEKTPLVEGILTGVKGQYLIIDNLYVLNVRKYTGYHLNIRIN